MTPAGNRRDAGGAKAGIDACCFHARRAEHDDSTAKTRSSPSSDSLGLALLWPEWRRVRPRPCVSRLTTASPGPRAATPPFRPQSSSERTPLENRRPPENCGLRGRSSRSCFMFAKPVDVFPTSTVAGLAGRALRPRTDPLIATITGPKRLARQSGPGKGRPRESELGDSASWRFQLVGREADPKPATALTLLASPAPWRLTFRYSLRTSDSGH